VTFHAAVNGRSFNWGESSADERWRGWFGVPLCTWWNVFTEWWLVGAGRHIKVSTHDPGVSCLVGEAMPFLSSNSTA
jgi:hypothetical protein